MQVWDIPEMGKLIFKYTEVVLAASNFTGLGLKTASMLQVSEICAQNDNKILVSVLKPILSVKMKGNKTNLKTPLENPFWPLK